MSQNEFAILRELGFRYDPSNLYQQVIGTVLDAAEALELPHHLQLIMAQPKNELMVHFPVRMDDGHFRLFKGYRVQHNNILGPYKGGIRYHNGVSLDHVKSLAVLMTMKCSLVRLPYGGGKGGLQVDPRSLSHDEMMRLTRRFTSALGDNIGPGYDIPAPDVGTNSQVMAWMADTYHNITSRSTHSQTKAVVTGKPIEFGGSHGRDKATGQGLVYILEQLLPEMDMPLDELTYSVIGYGNVGSWTARLLSRLGPKLRAVMDHTGAIVNEQGIAPEKLAQHVDTTGGIAGFEGADVIDQQSFYSQDVDVLIPAALEQMIGEDEAALIRARAIAEGANAPMTPAAEKALAKRDVAVLPAVLCNCGGVTVSYFEWKQNLQAESWEPEQVDAALRKAMYAAAQRVKLAAHRFDCSMRMAAYITALEHIGKVYQTRGIFP